MVVVRGLEAVEGRGTGVGEEPLDFARERGPIVLQRQQIVGALVADGLGDLGLTAHGVDRDQRAGQFQPLEQCRDCSDFIGLFFARLLAEHEPLARRPGRHQMQRVLALAFVMSPARGLAIDGDDVRIASAQALHPGDEALREGFGWQGVDHIVECVMGGDAVLQGQEAAQKIELFVGPALDLDEIIGPGHRRAQHTQQDLRQGIDHLP